jgi:hypothetical protein
MEDDGKRPGPISPKGSGSTVISTEANLSATSARTRRWGSVQVTKRHQGMHDAGPFYTRKHTSVGVKAMPALGQIGHPEHCGSQRYDRVRSRRQIGAPFMKLVLIIVGLLTTSGLAYAACMFCP